MIPMSTASILYNTTGSETSWLDGESCLPNSPCPKRTEGSYSGP